MEAAVGVGGRKSARWCALGLVLAASPAIAQPSDVSHRPRPQGVHLRILRDYRLAENAVSHEPIVVIGGSATIDGTADADVIVVAGNLRIGPKAVVRGNVAAVGGEAFIHPAATITGRVEEAAIESRALGFAGRRFPTFRRLPDRFWFAAALGMTTLRLGVVLFVSVLLSLVAPGWIRGIAARAASGSGTAAAVGVVGQLLFGPAMIAIVTALLVSVVGIPLLIGLPFLVGVGAIVWVAGFAAVASRVGGRLRRSDPVGGSLVLDLVVGFIAVAAVTIGGHLVAFSLGWTALASTLAGVGLFVEYIAWTVGLGAALMLMFGGRERDVPPLPTR
jgi:hypothetical protein